MWMLFGGGDEYPQSVYEHPNFENLKANTEKVTVVGMATVYDTLFTMFRLTLVDEWDYEVTFP